MDKRLIVTFLLSVFALFSFGQQCPSREENIPFLCTFSPGADKTWGDDDNVQIIFFVVPVSESRPVYIRIFDGDCGNQYDEVHGAFNSTTRFSVYGGPGAHSSEDAKKPDPSGNYKSGVMLGTKTFSAEAQFDNNWVMLGPFNPQEGELQPEVGGKVFKVVIEGLTGDDGNLYKLFLSASGNKNLPVEGGNMFTYEYTFRISDQKNSVCHLYPYITSNIIAVKVNVFDFDNDGIIRVVSIAKRGELAKTSGDGGWICNTHNVVPEEYNSSYDIQFIKQKEARNNNVVVYITNQYNQLMPFYTSPIGGVPRYKYKIGVKAAE